MGIFSHLFERHSFAFEGAMIFPGKEIRRELFTLDLKLPNLF
jgi:hypothetical protein